MNASADFPQNSGEYCAIDIGGTSVKWMIASREGQIVAQGKEPSEVATICDQVVDLCLRRQKEYPLLRSVGISTPGIVDEDNGVVIFASNLNLAGVRLAESITSATGLLAAVGHDGRNAGIAEGLMGAGRGAASFMMIPIGTGISAAIFEGGHMIAGETFSAGEIGHAPVVLGGEDCRCGQKGCLEVYASAKGIARRYAQRTGNDIGTRAIEKALPFDPIAEQVWCDAIDAMAMALAQHTLTLDPARIIIGGGLSRAGNVYMQPLRERLAQMLAWRSAPEIVTAELGDMAGMWGAAILACRTAESDDYSRWRI